MQKLNNTFIQLVNILNDGQYHDGTTIGKRLNITRSAIWKSIKKLIQYGVNIDSIKGRGYALREPFILLDRETILNDIKQPITLDVFETLESTNQYLKNFFNGNTIRVCLTEQQTQGKGRMQRTWHSPFGQNIYFSCLYSFQQDMSELSGLSLTVSLAVAKTIREMTAISCQVKWPNDIIYQGKKVSGNLIEIQAESHGICYAIIGIGINVNMLHDHDEIINQPWTSLREITGHYYNRNPFISALMNNLLTYLPAFSQLGLAHFIDEWNQYDYLFNQPITLSNANHTIHGIAKGINQYGHLLLESNGITKAFSSGDTQIIKR